MNLADVAKRVIGIEPPDRNSKVHMLGSSIGVWAVGEDYCLSFTERYPDNTTHVLSLDVDRYGSLADGVIAILGPEEESAEYTCVDNSNLSGMANYILSHCQKILP